MLALAMASLLAGSQARAAPSLTALIQTIDLASPRLSPDGRSVAYERSQASIDTNSYVLSWWVAPLDAASPPHAVADGGDALWTDAGVMIHEPAQWSPDGRWIYFRALVQGAVQVWRSPSVGGAREQVTHDTADVDAFSILSPDRLIYRVGAARADILCAEDRQSAQGVRIDRTVDVAQNLMKGGVINGRLAAERLDGEWFTHVGLLNEVPRRFRVVDLSAMTVRPADPLTDAVSLLHPVPSGTLAQKGSGGREAKLSVEQGRTVLSVEEPGANGVARRYPGPAGWSDRITSFAWRPGHDELIVTTLDPSKRQSLFSWTLDHNQVRRLATGSGLLSGGADADTPCAIGAELAVCVQSDALSPPSLVSINLESGALRGLDSPNPRPNEPLIRAEPLAWSDEHGRRFTGVLLTSAMRPLERTPLFITYYACSGYLRGGVGDEWPLAPMAAAGIAALCINTPPRNGRAQDALADYQTALSGVRAIINRLSKSAMIDPKRVGMGGLSFGSEVTLWVAMNSDLLAAASIASPQLEPSYWWFNGVAGRDQHAILRQVFGLGDPERSPRRWRRLSPALNADRIHTPLLMQLPEREFRYEMELYAKLSNSTTPVEMDVFPDEAHIKAQPRHRLAVYQRNLDWFEFWLKGRITSGEDVGSDTERWTRMRDVARPTGAQASDHVRLQASTSARSRMR